MKNKQFLYFLLALLAAVICVILFLQYNSNKNIDQLIKGNDALIDEFGIIGETQKLQTDLLYIESEIYRTVIGEDSSYLPGIREKEKSVRLGLTRIKPLVSTDSAKKLVLKLDSLVEAKLTFGDSMLTVLFTTGQSSAEIMYKSRNGKNAMGNIVETIGLLNSPRRSYLTHLSAEADKNGHRAMQWGFIMALIAVSACFFALFNIRKRIKRQQQLYDQLNASEMRARDAGIMKENFMANMSHEIRTPMNAILGFANLLQKEPINDKSKQFVSSILTSGENLLTIINDVLDFSKIEAGMMRIECSPFSLRELLHSVETMFSARITMKKLQLTVDVQKNIPDLLKGDSVRLTQIIVNLVNNSVKFTSSGSVEIKVTGKNQTEESIDIHISVKDTGIGIAADKLQTIFDRFQQADEETTRKYGGTGLGLSIVKQLVELQNGSIEVSSMQNMGTEFKVTIPYAISEEILSDNISDMSLRSLYLPDDQNTKILIVEDNILNQTLMKHLLTEWKLGYEIVNNGREAVELLRRKNLKLILMDIQMPEMDGYSATQKIRHELKLNIPIIAMTAHALAGEREKCLSMGMNDYISKPIREAELFKIINNLLYQQGNLHQSGFGIKDSMAVLDLDYLKEISGGDTHFERTMMEQFVQQVPGELDRLKGAMERKDMPELASVAHNMKTTISFMGLSGKLSGELEFIETNAANADVIPALNEKIFRIEEICHAALVETNIYLDAGRDCKSFPGIT